MQMGSLLVSPVANLQISYRRAVRNHELFFSFSGWGIWCHNALLGGAIPDQLTWNLTSKRALAQPIGTPITQTFHSTFEGLGVRRDATSCCSTACPLFSPMVGLSVLASREPVSRAPASCK